MNIMSDTNAPNRMRIVSPSINRGDVCEGSVRMSASHVETYRFSVTSVESTRVYDIYGHSHRRHRRDGTVIRREDRTRMRLAGIENPEESYMKTNKMEVTGGGSASSNSSRLSPFWRSRSRPSQLYLQLRKVPERKSILTFL